jgi:hypothetical protein
MVAGKEVPLMRTTIVVAFVMALAGCQREPELTPMERAAKDRSECHMLAIERSRFDPATAEAPPRTVSSTHERGGDVVGSGAIAKGAAKGAVVGVIGGAIAGEAGTGAAVGAAAGGLIGGARRRRETKELVTTTLPNPDYQLYMEAKAAYRHALEQCLAERAVEGKP